MQVHGCCLQLTISVVALQKLPFNSLWQAIVQLQQRQETDNHHLQNYQTDFGAVRPTNASWTSWYQHAKVPSAQRIVLHQNHTWPPPCCCMLQAAVTRPLLVCASVKDGIDVSKPPACSSTACMPTGPQHYTHIGARLPSHDHRF